jgi:putative heme-binding domain-containing protein
MPSVRYTSLIIIVLLVGPPPQSSAQLVGTQQPTIAPSRAIDQPAKPAEDEPKKTGDWDSAKGPKPNWIWGQKAAGGNDSYIFRRTFEADVASALILASCDNEMTIKLNGKRVAFSDSWQAAVRMEVGKFLVAGKNLLVVEGNNAGGPAGLVLKLILKKKDGTLEYIITDDKWTAARSADAKPAPAVAVGTLGSGPWGNVFTAAAAPSPDRGLFQLQPGFQVELLYTVPKNEQGSWVSIAFDDKGRLIASDQGNKGLYRLTLPAIGSDQPTKVEKLELNISSSQGMLYAFDSLYISVNGGPGSGLYRARDTNGDDQYDELTKLKALAGGGEHGPHGLRLGPDGKSIYIIAGNHTNPPDGITSSTIPTNWSEDLLLPRQWDARGHARGKLAPGGWIAKTDPDGATWEMISIGYRNPYDMDFSPEGELFAYDADMEWDMGSPWYRPTRVVHAVSGSEFGWRSGTGKWPTYYADSLPPLVNLGPGSPVGVTFGTGARFPAEYQRAIYVLDWTFGTMYAVHLEPEGASYVGRAEEFVARTPLPLTDAEVGPDGALYFTVGGRGAQSELFRVTYVGEHSTNPAVIEEDKFSRLRRLRRSLEAYHGHASPAAVKAGLSQLGNPDRHIRYAARLVMEAQPVDQWGAAVLAMESPTARITGIIGLARQADKSLQSQIFNALLELDPATLGKADQLAILRAYALSFIRQGRPDDETAVGILKQLDGLYPTKDDQLNREYARLLVYLNSPTVVTKTLALMAEEREQTNDDLVKLLARNRGYGGTIRTMLENHPDLQKTHYALVLRNMRFGWTLEQRKAYFSWFNEARTKSGGASYQGFINNIQNEALANVSEAEKKALAATVIPPPPKPEELPKPEGPGHKWELSEVVELAAGGLIARDFENGRTMFAAARCGSCHRFDGDGGATGPDLSNVAGRFSVRDLAEALILPSKVISDQYRGTLIVTVDGKVITGRLAGEQDGILTVLTDPYDSNKVTEIKKDDVDELRPAPKSLMPEDLINELNADEVRNLIAYMLSRGNPNDRMFQK